MTILIVLSHVAFSFEACARPKVTAANAAVAAGSSACPRSTARTSPAHSVDRRVPTALPPSNRASSASSA
jgi:hypothetical protein